MREFYLKNKDGAIYNLTGLGFSEKLESLFYNVSGLGFEVGGDFARLGSDYVRTSKFYTQKPISGTMFFAEPDSYQKYFDFNRFVERAPLKIIYKPDNDLGEFERDIEVTSLIKSEIGVNGLYCDIDFTPISLIKKIVFATSEKVASGGKQYNYQYDYQYSDGANNSITFNVDSNLKSPLTLTIKGPCKNPEWRHYLNGKLVASGKVNVTVLPGAELIVDSNLPFSITELDSSGEFSVDVYQKSDFSTERFLFLEHGQNVISATDSDGNVLVVTGKGYVTYASV